MSHFVVLVFTEEKPTEQVLTAALQPFHEYECTGVEDQYVIDVDVTDKVNEQWGQQVDAVRLADGKILSRYDSSLYRKEADGETKFFLPDGATEIQIPQTELSAAKGETLEEFAADYGGYEKKADGRFYDRTNPNKKWDWWSVGGRWTGMLSGYDPEDDPANREICSICGGAGMRNDEHGVQRRAEDPTYTCNGCGGNGWRVKWPTAWKSHTGDSMRVGDANYPAIRGKAAREAGDRWDKSRKILGDTVPWRLWKDVHEEHKDDIEKAREIYHEQPAYKAACTKEGSEISLSWNLDQYAVSREEYVRAAEEAAGIPLACLLNGKWHERGEMGWWGVIHDEKPRDDWNTQFRQLLESVPPDWWVTVVDCHI